VTMSDVPSLWNHWGSQTHIVQAGRNGEFSVPVRSGRVRIVALPPARFTDAFRRLVNFDDLGPLGSVVAVGDRETARVELQLIDRPR